jgi:cytochrome c oxidase cbb3-type subunit III
MDIRTRFGLVVCLVTAGAAPVAAQSSSEATATRPPNQTASDSAAAPAPGSSDATSSTAVNAALITKGDAVFHGPGNCYACHGSNATGSVGPNLTDAEWIHSKGTYEDIVAQINAGIPKEQSKSGIAMPARGGGTINDDDVKAVAAYVYSLRQK